MGEDWLRYRLAFFWDAAHPSVAAQRDADFTWLVMFDDRCSDAFRQDVEELAADGVFVPIWTHEPFWDDRFASHVAARSTAPYVITTRMDSDDAIAVDFLASVQRQFEHQDLLFVDFVRGLQIDRRGWVYRHDQLSNPFLSLIERRPSDAPPRTVFLASQHPRARRYAPVREVKAPPMWLQVIHDANIANLVNGTRVSPSQANDRFVLDLAYRREVPGLTLVRERAVQRARLARLWGAHPGELLRHLEAGIVRARGTHDLPQNDNARNATDLARRLAARLGRSNVRSS
ncbi:Putative rhamnosyl transferase [Raineyella antarctica]|uniref:Putative rhamnosyl transferase n=2 Tax=Raineyella antarctica TaxID=1577474 RepID=A0A1G6GD05_9ACTN|nr:Putative rhamnosyl transferase [Raineyella antarctica]